jgi:signal transduction histidine kinase
VNVEYAVNPVVEAESGEVTGAVMIMRDIEARIRLENLKKAFIANVSHELRTPLTAIKGALALLLGGAMGDLAQEQQHMLNVAHTSTDRLVRLVDDLLDLGRLDANRLTLHPRLCSVAELSRLALNDVAGAAQASGIQLIEQLSESVAHLGLEVDPDRIVQILVNLLGNAVRFSATGQRVVLTADATESGIRFSVRDFGPGIQDSERAVIFERFMQSNSPDQRIIGGTGLGLAIASELARAHQGHLELGDVKVGSIFHLHLPHPEARAEVA